MVDEFILVEWLRRRGSKWLLNVRRVGENGRIWNSESSASYINPAKLLSGFWGVRVANDSNLNREANLWFFFFFFWSLSLVFNRLSLSCSVTFGYDGYPCNSELCTSWRASIKLKTRLQTLISFYKAVAAFYNIDIMWYTNFPLHLWPVHPFPSYRKLLW